MPTYRVCKDQLGLIGQVSSDLFHRNARIQKAEIVNAPGLQLPNFFLRQSFQ